MAYYETQTQTRTLKTRTQKNTIKYGKILYNKRQRRCISLRFGNKYIQVDFFVVLFPNNEFRRRDYQTQLSTQQLVIACAYIYVLFHVKELLGLCERYCVWDCREVQGLLGFVKGLTRSSHIPRSSLSESDSEKNIAQTSKKPQTLIAQPWKLFYSEKTLPTQLSIL